MTTFKRGKPTPLNMHGTAPRVGFLQKAVSDASPALRLSYTLTVGAHPIQHFVGTYPVDVA
jgi:hypothetical protein